MDFIKICLMVLFVVIFVNSLPTFSREISILVTISCCIVVLLYILNKVMPALEYIKNIAETTGLEDIKIIIKAVGIGFLTQFVSDMALDCNNKLLSNQIVFAGRIAVIILSLPVYLKIFEIIERII